MELSARCEFYPRRNKGNTSPSAFRNCFIGTKHVMTSSNGNIFRVTGPFHWSPLNSPHKGQWRRALIFFIWASINAWVNNREAGDLRRHHAHYDVIVMNYLNNGTQTKQSTIKPCTSYPCCNMTKRQSSDNKWFWCFATKKYIISIHELSSCMRMYLSNFVYKLNVWLVCNVATFENDIFLWIAVKILYSYTVNSLELYPHCHFILDTGRFDHTSPEIHYCLRKKVILHKARKIQHNVQTRKILPIGTPCPALGCLLLVFSRILNVSLRNFLMLFAQFSVGFPCHHLAHFLSLHL